MRLTSCTFSLLRLHRQHHDFFHSSPAAPSSPSLFILHILHILPTIVILHSRSLPHCPLLLDNLYRSSNTRERIYRSLSDIGLLHCFHPIRRGGLPPRTPSDSGIHHQSHHNARSQDASLSSIRVVGFVGSVQRKSRPRSGNTETSERPNRNRTDHFLCGPDNDLIARGYDGLSDGLTIRFSSACDVTSTSDDDLL